MSNATSVAGMHMKVSACSKFPYVSVITMIAPSPDWFTGTSTYSLCDESSGELITSAWIEVFPYDSGTDSGSDFTSPNKNTQPPEPITAMGQVFGDAADVNPVGYVIITQVGNDSSIDCDMFDAEGPAPAPPDSAACLSYLPLLLASLLILFHCLAV